MGHRSSQRRAARWTFHFRLPRPNVESEDEDATPRASLTPLTPADSPDSSRVRERAESESTQQKCSTRAPLHGATPRWAVCSWHRLGQAASGPEAEAPAGQLRLCACAAARIQRHTDEAVTSDHARRTSHHAPVPAPSSVPAYQSTQKSEVIICNLYGYRVMNCFDLSMLLPRREATTRTKMTTSASSGCCLSTYYLARTVAGWPAPGAAESCTRHEVTLRWCSATT
jgi:hypothetical protein